MLERTAANFHFEGKLEGEEIHYLFFKHILSEVREWLMLFFLYLAPLLSLVFFAFLLPVGIPMFWIFVPFYFVFMGTYIFILWMNDICDIWLLTNKRIIDITQRGFLSRRTSIAELNNIQNVNFSQKGPLQAMFNIGTVEIQTAGTSPDLEQDYLESPGEVADLVLLYSRNYKKDQNVLGSSPTPDEPKL